MPASVGERLTKRVEELNAKIAEAFEPLKTAEDPVQRDKGRQGAPSPRSSPSSAASRSAS